MISDLVWDDDYKEVRGVVPEGSGLGAPNTRSAALRQRESGWLLPQPYGFEGFARQVESHTRGLGHS